MSAGIAPLVNGILWSFTIGFGCWIAVQLMEALETFGAERPPELPEMRQEAPTAGAAQH